MSQGTPIRVELKRADVADLVLKHELLKVSLLVLALGDTAAAVLVKGIGRRYPEGTSVFHQGQLGESVFFVLRGEARLTAVKNEQPSEVGRASAGDVFGESEALAAGPRSCSAHASQDLDVVELSRAALLGRDGLPLELLAYLRDVKAQRGKATDELASFLDRW